MYGNHYQPAAWWNSSNVNNSVTENLIWGSGSSYSLPIHHPGIGEEGPAEADESLVLRAAVQDLHQPKLEANLPEGLLSVPPLRHQKVALAPMLNKESSGLCLGGILADDQGLGKTVSMIALILMQRHLQAKAKHNVSYNSRTEALNLDDDDDDGNSSLIVLDDANLMILRYCHGQVIQSKGSIAGGQQQEN